MKRIHICTAGTFTDNKGVPHTITAEHLATVARNYNAGRPHDAALTVGHPDPKKGTRDPAYGWVDRLVAAGKDLFAVPKDVVAAFSALVEKNIYKHVSPAFYIDPATGDPNGLQHVAFLGGIAPAIPGLQQIAFAEGDAMVLTIEFSQTASVATTFNSIGRLFRGLREYFVGAVGENTADALFPEDEINNLLASSSNGTDGLTALFSQDPKKPAQYAGVPDDEFADRKNFKYPVNNEEHTRAALSYWGKPDNRKEYSEEEQKAITGHILAAAKKFGIEVSAEFNDHSSLSTISPQGVPMTAEETAGMEELKKKVAEFSAAVATLTGKVTVVESENASLRSAIANQAQAIRTAEFSAFVERLIVEGRVLPVLRDETIETLEAKYRAGLTAEFSQGEGATREKPVDAYKKKLEGLPTIEFSAHIATRQNAGAPAGIQDATAKIEKLVADKMAADNTISFNEATRQVFIAHPDLAAQVQQG